MIILYIVAGVVLAPLLMLVLLLGTLGAVHVLRTPEPPLDQSNLFNRLRVVWFSFSRQADMVRQFPWLLRDEWQNVNQQPHVFKPAILRNQLEQIARDLGSPRSEVINLAAELIGDEHPSELQQIVCRQRLELEQVKRTANELAQQAAVISKVNWPNERPLASDIVITKRGTVSSYDDLAANFIEEKRIKYVIRINQEHLPCL
jgi:hypothetical protein